MLSPGQGGGGGLSLNSGFRYPSPVPVGRFSAFPFPDSRFLISVFLFPETRRETGNRKQETGNRRRETGDGRRETRDGQPARTTEDEQRKPVIFDRPALPPAPARKS